MECCDCEMTMMAVNEHFAWIEDIPVCEVIETWECAKCGVIENVDATDKWLCENPNQCLLLVNL